MVKHSGSGPSTLQMFSSTSKRIFSSKPRGWVACSEKYLSGGTTKKQHLESHTSAHTSGSCISAVHSSMNSFPPSFTEKESLYNLRPHQVIYLPYGPPAFESWKIEIKITFENLCIIPAALPRASPSSPSLVVQYHSVFRLSARSASW